MYGSRKRLLLYWLPFNLLSISIVVFTSSVLFSVEPNRVKEVSRGLFHAGRSLQTLYIFLVVRDFVIFAQYMIVRDYLGFWKVIIFHWAMLPVDCFFILVLCIWGAAQMNT